jgi:hypothetical protein
MSKTFLEKGRKTLGYTIDQTILVVAIIAILITLIIASVGWDLITRAGGTKLASNLKQVEDAHGSFYGIHGMWVDTALATDDALWVANEDDTLLVLKTNIFTGGVGTRFNDNHKNLLAGILDDGVNLLSPFGDGAQPMSFFRSDHTAAIALSTSFVTGNSWVLAIPGVPTEEAMQADSAIDGSDDITSALNAGRVILNASGSPCNAGNVAPAGPGDAMVELCYIANSIN